MSTPAPTPPVNEPAKANWLVLNPKVKYAFIAVALVALSAATLALNGTETWNVALISIGTALITAVTAYLKSA